MIREALKGLVGIVCMVAMFAAAIAILVGSGV